MQSLFEKYKEKKVGLSLDEMPIGLQVNEFLSWVEVKTEENKSKSNNTKSETSDRLKSIEVKNYHVLEDIELPNLKSDEIYILGENGTGKTLLFRCVLWCMKRILIEEDKKYIKQTAWIPKLFESNSDIFIGINTVNGVEYVFEKTEETEQRLLENIFAYGVNRSYIENNQEYAFEFLSLFDSNKDYSLKDPMQWLKDKYIDEQLGSKTDTEFDKLGRIKLEEIKKFMNLLFIKEDGEEETEFEIEVNHKQVTFKNKATGEDLDFKKLSDGYKSVFTWLVDLIARMSENQSGAESIADFEAVVLVDELDLFLHPRWAYKIVGKLREKLPKVQFIITTHNPILTLGASDDAIFYKLYKENGVTKISEPITGVKNLTVNNLVTSPIWGLGTFAMPKSKDTEIDHSDYLTKLIRKAIEKKMKEKPLIGDDLMEEIEQELENMNI